MEFYFPFQEQSHTRININENTEKNKFITIKIFSFFLCDAKRVIKTFCFEIDFFYSVCNPVNELMGCFCFVYGAVFLFQMSSLRASTITLICVLCVVVESAVLISDIRMHRMIEFNSKRPFCKSHTDRYVT